MLEYTIIAYRYILPFNSGQHNSCLEVFYTPEHVSLEKNILKNDIHCTDKEYQMKNEKKREKNIFQYPQSLIIFFAVFFCFSIAFAQIMHCILRISCSDSMAVIKKSNFIETE